MRGLLETNHFPLGGKEPSHSVARGVAVSGGKEGKEGGVLARSPRKEKRPP